MTTRGNDANTAMSQPEAQERQDDIARKEQEPAKEITIQRNDTNAVMPRPEAQERQDVGERKAASPKEPQRTNQQEPSETARRLAMWSVCLIVASVCFVCLALSIHAPRGEVNTIIDSMMVSSPLQRHRTLQIQINE